MITDYKDIESPEDTVIRLRSRLQEVADSAETNARKYRKDINELVSQAIDHDTVKLENEDLRRQLNSMTAERGKWLRKLKRAGVKL